MLDDCSTAERAEREVESAGTGHQVCLRWQTRRIEVDCGRRVEVKERNKSNWGESVRTGRRWGREASLCDTGKNVVYKVEKAQPGRPNDRIMVGLTAPLVQRTRSSPSAQLWSHESVAGRVAALRPGLIGDQTMYLATLLSRSTYGP